MINITQHGWSWDLLDTDYGQGLTIQVFSTPSVRDSKLLDATGEPFQVGYERPKLGFDLRKRHD